MTADEVACKFPVRPTQDMTETRPSDSSVGKFSAGGGGSGTAAGISFQAHLGAWFASHLLAEWCLPARLGGRQVTLLHFEAETPTDDILVKSEFGWLFVQAKSTLTLSERHGSELAKVAKQFVRQWIACSQGKGDRDWNRPLSLERNRLVLAVGPNAPSTITHDLKEGLATFRHARSAPLPAKTDRALQVFIQHLIAAWKVEKGQGPSKDEIQSIARLATVVEFRFDGADGSVAEGLLANVLDHAAEPRLAFSLLSQHCQELMQRRLGCDMGGLQRNLAAKGIRLKAPPSFQNDVERLLQWSRGVQERLRDHESIELQGRSIRVERACSDAVVDAARSNSLLLVGEPGAGKSALVSMSARQLADEGFDVLVFAVDGLSVSSRSEMVRELEINHPLCDVLANWPGNQPAILFLDALDATRGGKNETVFRTLIEDVLALDERKWRVVASIRSFDLQTGTQFRQLFRGDPPSAEFSDSAFSEVLHVHVPPWTHEELATLLRRAPDLAVAVDAGGDRLRNLARVPFNTQLLSELISSGVTPHSLGDVQSQVQLLSRYWEHRIERHGTPAELCLRDAIDRMIEVESLQVRKLEVAAMNAENSVLLDDLLHENVFLSTRQGQLLRFRHHVLFDYAASRVYLDIDDLSATSNRFSQKDGLGLMLAQALSYSLMALWEDTEENSKRFWEAIVRLCGNADCDPVARAVAAGVASQLPHESSDALGLRAALLNAGQDGGIDSSRALGNVISAVFVRLEDEQSIPLDFFCELAEHLLGNLDEWAWPLRALLNAIHKRADSDENRSRIGRAARGLLEFCLEKPDSDPMLSRAAIDVVAATYGTDVEGSRNLFLRLFAAERFQSHGDQEIPQLARNASSICNTDPELLVEIYGSTFIGNITDGTTTQLGQSKVVVLTSTRQQDYKMAWWSLGEFFPQFLDSHTLQAVRALARALWGYAQRKGRIDSQANNWVMPIPGGTIRLQEDRSCAWACNMEKSRGDPERVMIYHFMRFLESAEADLARAMIGEIAAANKVGILWARTFMVAARRPGEIGDSVWPLATQEPFLTCWDTRKDAIDFIAARYPFESEKSRRAFERYALQFEFSSSGATDARSRIIKVLFRCVGEANLVTSEARAFLAEKKDESNEPLRNERPIRFETNSEGGAIWQESRGRETESSDPETASVLKTAQKTKANVQEIVDGSAGIEDLTKNINGVAHLLDEVVRADNELPASIVKQVLKMAAEAAARVSGLLAKHFSNETQAVESLIALVLRLAELPVEPWSPETQAQFEEPPHGWDSPDPAVETAIALMEIGRINSECAQAVLPAIELFLGVPNPAARMQVAQRLAFLAQSTPNRMWALAEYVVSEEQNLGVLRFFAQDFLRYADRIDAARAEQLVFKILALDLDRDKQATVSILQELGSRIAGLSIYRNRPEPSRQIESWLTNPEEHHPELESAIRVAADAIDLKYKDESPENEEITLRAQRFCLAVAEASARRYQHFFEVASAGEATQSDQKRGQLCAMSLDALCGQIHLAAKEIASDDARGSGRRRNELIRAFLNEMKPTLEQIADVAAPPTIYRLSELLELLLPGNPAQVFDLLARALLNGGRKHGYEYDSMAAERFVKIVGILLADHRELFDDMGRRQRLIECLNVLSEVGWPDARRLLHRLSTLLR